MSRTQTQGIEYFPFDVDFFADKKVRILKARYGSDGVNILIYLLCAIYREGYFTKYDEDFKFIISDDLGIRSETVEQVITYLLSRSMFDEQVFQSAEVLTSHGIQERWINAVKSRALKTPLTVSDHWLLSEAETPPFIKCTLFNNSSTKKEDNSTKKDDNSTKKDHKVKKSKVNIPPNPQTGEWEQGIAKIKEYLPNLICNCKPVDGIDFDGLCERLKFGNAYLLNTMYLSRLIDQYDDIMGGKYEDQEKRSKAVQVRAGNRREYYEHVRSQAEKIAEENQKKARVVKGYNEAQKAVVDAIMQGKDETPYIAEVRRLLASIGLTEEDLQPNFRCAKCKDTGYTEGGVECDCYKGEV